MKASTRDRNSKKMSSAISNCNVNKVMHFSILFYLTSHSEIASHENKTRQNKKKKDLEENSLSVPTESAADGLGSGKSWVRSYILQDLCSLPSSVVHLTPIDTVIVRDLLNQTRISNVILNL